MCDQWSQNTSLLDVSVHVLSCAKCLYSKLDQFKQATEENKGKMNKMKKMKQLLKTEVDLLEPYSPNHNVIMDKMRAMVRSVQNYASINDCINLFTYYRM